MTRRLACALFVVAALAGNQASLANVALYNVTGTPVESPSGNSNHGWEFVANSPITVSNLGLYDFNNDGFDIDRPIGLFRLSDSVRWPGTIHAGTVDTDRRFSLYRHARRHAGRGLALSGELLQHSDACSDKFFRGYTVPTP
jgi:hypothetical protein